MRNAFRKGFVDTKRVDWQSIYLVILSITVVVTVVITGLFDRCPNACSDLLEVVEVGTPKGIIYGTFIVSMMEVIRIMVMLPADYLRLKLIKPLEDRIFNRGKVEMHAEIVEWLEDKEEAEREGREFNEPMPTPDRNGSEPQE